MSVLAKNVKVTIGGPEVTPGTPVARQFVIPHTGVPSLTRTPERTEDPAVVGRNMSSGEVLVAASVGGSVSLSPRPVGGFGKVVRSVLGGTDTPVEVGGCLRIRYSGSAASAKVVVSDAADSITISTGALGSETADTDVGTAGVIDLTGLGTDTLAELQAEIDGYTDYAAEIIMGAGGLDVSSPVAITAAQAKGRWVYIWFAEVGSGKYLHRIPVDLTNTARPVYSVQVDGVGDNLLHSGVVFDSFSVSGAVKALIEGQTETLGLTETGGQSASALTLENIDPLVLFRSSITFGVNDYSDVSDLSVEMRNNHNADGYGQGTPDRVYHERGMFEGTCQINVRLNATSYAERAKTFTSDEAGFSFYAVDADSAASVSGMILVEMPYVTVASFEIQDSNDVLRAQISGKAVRPKGTVYNDPTVVSLVTADSAGY